MHKGRTYIRSTGTANKKLATQIEAKYRIEVLQSAELGIGTDVALNFVVDDYLKSKKHQSNYGPLCGHAKITLKHIKGAIKLSNIHTRDINKLHQALIPKYSPGYIKSVFVTLGAILRYAAENGYSVPTVKIPKIRVKPDKLRFLTAAEETALLAELTPADQDKVRLRDNQIHDAHDLVICLLDTGCRYGEITRLEWASVDFNQNTITIFRPKVSNESVLQMTNRVKTILLARFEVASTQWIFPSRDLTSHRSKQSPCIRKAMNRVGLHSCTVHTLRHTFASRLATAGVSLFKIGAILGHSSPLMTARYAHLLPNQTALETTSVINSFNENNNEK